MKKADIRQKMKICRAAEKFSKEKSQKIIEFLRNFDLFRRSKKILFFAGFQNEPDLLPLAAENLLEKSIFFPKILDAKRGKMAAAKIIKISDLEKSDFGILAPKTFDFFPAEKLDLVLVPALAVDFSGDRVGFGGGFYDRFLAKIRAKRVAVVFDFQKISEKIPAEKTDQKMDFVATEKGIFRF